ncbi:tRNA-splicing endonuclease subunit Sen2 isoform X2 [Myripristis murdjan]|uniref:tRNA-splicing endonuclease subunit Sen2 isoform X2 n=1 Tax=Myripristis murdjan TaxID=586833 RepID=UPI001175E74F|nr:tRNA-splicing endonuclease subunit Sen2 isoform X2 [Myripristis murdjan]
MLADFQPPRRRCRVQEQFEAPLPLDGEHFRAVLLGGHVLVCTPTHIQHIYSKGYFGKGVLSRARPDHSISNQWEEHGGLFLPVISHSRYEELLSWTRSALLAQGLDEEEVSQELLRRRQPVELEDLTKEVAGEENGHGEGSGGGACSQRKRQRAESEVESGAKRACRLDPPEDQSPAPESDCDPEMDPESDCDPASSADSALGLVLVELDGEGGQGGGRREVRPTPFSLTESLQLSLEEAFFLVYALGCLSVYQDQEPLPVVSLWRKFCSLQPGFSSSYAAYHHYRSRGWVPKTGGGAKYGADLMLYRKGPPFYHASYSVVVERMGEAFRGSAPRLFTWRSLAALSRITSNVSKELMMCYVIYPDDLSESELDSPLCLHRLTVQEVIISRWISSRERAEQDDL